MFVYEECRAFFLWKHTFYKTRYKKAICVLLKDLSRGTPENMVLIAFREKISFPCTMRVQAWSWAGSDLTLKEELWLCAAWPSPALIPSPVQLRGTEVAINSREIHCLGKHINIQVSVVIKSSWYHRALNCLHFCQEAHRKKAGLPAAGKICCKRRIIRQSSVCTSE